MFSRFFIEEDIIYYGKKCGEKNFTPGYSGNISARYKKGMLITTSGSSNGYLERDHIVYTDFNGNPLENGKKPSSEKFLHIEIYKKRPDINYIIHVHSPYLSSFAASGKDLMEPVLAENVFYFGEIPVADYALPGSEKLVENTAKYFAKHNTVLLANHGIVIGAKDIKNAFYLTETAEVYAQIYLNSFLLGGAKDLSHEDIEEIYELRSKQGN